MHTLLIRADGDSRIGSGHFMRCLALAQAWQDRQGSAALATSSPVQALRDRAASEGLEIFPIAGHPGSPEDATQTVALAGRLTAAWVAVDGYQFGADYQQAIRHSGFRLLALDDYGHASHYCADAVLNQNLSADQYLYGNREPFTRLLLGPGFALLRREFRAWREWRRGIAPVARKVLVTLGGGDPDNVTLKVIRALGQMGSLKLEAVVLAGAANPHRGELAEAAREVPISMRLQGNVARISELMAWADVAVSAGGSTCWELAFLGLPSLLLTVADNQLAITRSLEERGVALSLGWHQAVSSEQIAQQLEHSIADPDLRARMSERGRKIVDGRGADRAVSCLLDGRPA